LAEKVEPVEWGGVELDAAVFNHHEKLMESASRSLSRSANSARMPLKIPPEKKI
jgi:hypothetical protein